MGAAVALKKSVVPTSPPHPAARREIPPPTVRPRKPTPEWLITAIAWLTGIGVFVLAWAWSETESNSVNAIERKVFIMKDASGGCVSSTPLSLSHIRYCESAKKAGPKPDSFFTFKLSL